MPLYWNIIKLRKFSAMLKRFTMCTCLTLFIFICWEKYIFNNKLLITKSVYLNWTKLLLMVSYMTRFNMLIFCLIFLSSCSWEIIFSFLTVYYFGGVTMNCDSLLDEKNLLFSLLSESTFSLPKCFVPHKDTGAWRLFVSCF